MVILGFGNKTEAIISIAKDRRITKLTMLRL